jgi:uncharacterized delta-60 repeat protein
MKFRNTGLLKARVILFTAFFSVCGVLHPAFASILTGDLDVAFHNVGHVRFGFGGGMDAGNAVAIQPDGKIVVAATSDQAGVTVINVLRFTAAGAPDLSFNGSGRVMIRLGSMATAAGGVAIQPDGKILIAGTTQPYSNRDFALIRLNPDGSRDTGFGVDGVVTTDFAGRGDDGRAILIQPDNKIVVVGDVESRSPSGGVGETHIGAARYHPNGTIDTSFNVYGKVTTAGAYASSAALQADGKIVVGGGCNVAPATQFCAVRFTAEGPVDPAFANSGRMVAYDPHFRSFASGVAVQPDGRIILAGPTFGGDRGFTFIRVNPDGTNDVSFGDNGQVFTGFGSGDDESRANSLILQPDGKILASGYGRPAGPGMTSLAAVRLNPDGSFDTSFNGTGKMAISVTAGNDQGLASVAGPDGKILIAGYGVPGDQKDILLSKFNADGTIDPQFGNSGTTTMDAGDTHSQIRAMALQPDQKIIVAGNQPSSSSGPRIARLNPDGSFDLSFNKSGKIILDDWSYVKVEGVAVQADEKILIAGNYPGGFMVGRIHSDGTIDESFGSGGRTLISSAYVNAIAVQPDGRIVLGGNSSTAGYTIFRFDAYGLPDRLFGRNGRAAILPDGAATGLAVQPDGKILSSGQVVENGKMIFVVNRLNQNGTADGEFGQNGVVKTDVTEWADYATSIALSSEGKIAVAGYCQINSGYSNFVVARYNSDGSLDTSFNGTGINRTYFPSQGAKARAVAFRSDGKIVLGGYTFRTASNDIATVRFLPDGSQDVTQWGEFGAARANLFGDDSGAAMVLDSFGRPIVAGTSVDLFCVTRFTSEFAPVSYVSISGRIMDHDERPIGQAVITMTDADGTVHTTVSSALGYYRFGSVETGSVHTFRISGRNCIFSPYPITVSGELPYVEFRPDLIFNYREVPGSLMTDEPIRIETIGKERSR